MVVPESDGQTPVEELFVQLRNKFIEELNVSSDNYDELDIERIRTDDAYCKRFIQHKKGNFDNAFAMLKEALAWRKSFDVKSVKEETIPLEFFQAKAVFPYNNDKEGHPIILLLVRFHKRAAEYAKDLRRFVIYWVEKMEVQSNGGRMTVVMNCSEAGLSNLDLDLIKFLITLFRSYYPDSLAYILIYEMPWIFNAAWKIIKAWLPEDFVDKIRFVNKTTVLEYIDKESLPVEMGGTCFLEYEPPSLENDVNSNNSLESSVNVRKRVHFSQNGGSLRNDNNLITGAPISPRAVRSPSKDGTSHLLLTDDFCILGGILKISPALELVFCPPANNGTIEVKIKLTSVAEKDITYKVKTNNISSYRVKPSIGIIEPNNSIDITVFLLQGYHPQPIDKFLIMAMEVPDSSVSITNLSQLWRNSPTDIMADHKLKCVVGVPESVKVKSEFESAIENMNITLTSLNSRMENLESSQKSFETRQKVSVYLLLFLALSFWVQVICMNGYEFLDTILSFF